MEEIAVEADGERYRTKCEAELAKIELQDNPMYAARYSILRRCNGMNDIVHRIAIKNKHVYDCMKHSEFSKSWRWVTGQSMAGWDPYYISGRPHPDEWIVLNVFEDERVMYSTRSEELAEAVPWAQW